MNRRATWYHLDHRDKRRRARTPSTDKKDNVAASGAARRNPRRGPSGDWIVYLSCPFGISPLPSLICSWGFGDIRPSAAISLFVFFNVCGAWPRLIRSIARNVVWSARSTTFAISRQGSTRSRVTRTGRSEPETPTDDHRILKSNSVQRPPTSRQAALGRTDTSKASTHACAMNCSMAKSSTR